MKIQYASDLHLEFPQNKDFLKANPLQPNGDVLLLAGDIVPFAVMDKHKDFFDYIADNFETTYWIPGNHEYYYFDAAAKSGTIHEKIRSNVILVNNHTVEIQQCKFIFSTLWSHINIANQWKIQQSLSDFHVIKYNGSPLSVEQYNLWHNEYKSFITNEISKSKADKTIVVTHHAPTFFNYPPKYKGDFLNEAFAVEMFDTIQTSSVDYWIYGHHHFNTPEFKIGNTLLLTNQLGYVKHNEHLLFNQNANVII